MQCAGTCAKSESNIFLRDFFLVFVFQLFCFRIKSQMCKNKTCMCQEDKRNIIIKKSGVMCRLRPAQDILAVGVEAHVPESNTVHQLLGGFELAIATENRVDEFTASVATHGDGGFAAVFALGGLPHELLAGFEQLLDAAPETFAALEKVLDGVVVVGVLDADQRFFGTLDFPRQLDEQQPEVARDVGHGGGGTVVEDGPVVDPFAQRIGVKDRAEQDDGSFCGVPVLEGVTGGDSGAFGVFLGGLGGGLGGGRGRLHGLGRGGAGRGGLATGTGALLVLGGIHIVLVGRRRHLVVIKVVISGRFWLAIMRLLRRRRRTTGRWESSVVTTDIVDHIDIDMTLERRRRTGRTAHGPTTGSTYMIVLAAARWRTKLRHGLAGVRLIEARVGLRRVPCGCGFLGRPGITGLATMTLGRASGRSIRACELRRVVGVMGRSRRRVGVVVGPPRRIVIHFLKKWQTSKKTDPRR